jgi:lambda family phage portal protein
MAWRLPFFRNNPRRPRTASAFLRSLQSPLLFAWNPSLREPLEEHREAWMDVTARTIDALHNSGWLAGGVEQATAAICGPSMALNARPDPSAFGDDEKAASVWARAVERRFELWARSPYECDFTTRQSLGQMCSQSVKTWFGLGEIAGVMRWKVRAGNSHGTKIQLIPPTRIPQQSRKRGLDSVQGVVLDDDGVPVAYCIENYNPIKPHQIEEEVVMARDVLGRVVVIHVHDSPPTVIRGISPMAPAIQVVRQYDQLANATLTAALIQAIFAATIESDAPTEHLLQALQEDEEQMTPPPSGQGATMGGVGSGAPGDWNRLMATRAEWYDHTKFDLGKQGKVLHIFPGEKLNFLRSEHPNDNYKPFSRTLLLEVARCLGITYEQLTGDREGATYSSERMGSAENWLICQHRRQHIAGRFMQTAFEAWLEEDIEQGFTQVPGGIEAFHRQRDAFCRADWRGPPKPTADEMKTARANAIKLANHVITREMWSADEGADWQDIDDQRARERDNAEELGLPTEPAQLTASGLPKGASGAGGGGDGDGYEASNALNRLPVMENKLDHITDELEE